MLIEQLPTSSSSSSAGADSGDRETSSQAHTENPSPPTPTAAPLPEVDEEAVRRIGRILRSMPPEMDTATVYANLKARLGIFRSRDPHPKILPKTPPSFSQTQAPLPTSTPTPVFPLVQYSGDDSEEEGAQPTATPAAEAESVPPPHAEGASAQNALSLPSGGGSNSPLQGPP